MKVLVTGGRGYTNRRELYDTLDEIARLSDISLVIHGGAMGADALADEWAKIHGFKVLRVPADWSNLEGPTVVIKTRRDGKKYNAAAGGIRNQKMVDMKPDLVVCFPGGRGTEDCASRARRCGLKVIAIGSGTLAASDGPDLLFGVSVGEPHHV